MSGEKNVPEKVHATLGASTSARWMACPGSVGLSQSIPPSSGSAYAQEGTRAHALAELCLTKGVEPEVYVGVELEGGVVDEDMAEFVRIYVEHCREVRAEASNFWIERKFNLAALNPPAAMFGTADFVAYDSIMHELHVVDLKYGAGVVVEVKGNKQLRYYALGAALSLDPAMYPIEHVTMTIVQPRAMHPDGIVRSETIPYYELVEFAADLMAAARETQKPDAPLNAGSHCRFCPASGVCPTQRDHALAVVQDEFSALDEWAPPAPETIPAEQFADMLGKLHILDDWMSAMRATALARLERGEDVPGFKLVAKRAQRKWSNTSSVEQWLEADGYELDVIYEPRDLRSVAQIEKMMGKKTFAASPIAANVVKVSSGYNMAPATDPRPAVIGTAVEEFARLLPAAEE